MFPVLGADGTERWGRAALSIPRNERQTQTPELLPLYRAAFRAAPDRYRQSLEKRSLPMGGIWAGEAALAWRRVSKHQGHAQPSPGISCPGPASRVSGHVRRREGAGRCPRHPHPAWRNQLRRERDHEAAAEPRPRAPCAGPTRSLVSSFAASHGARGRPRPGEGPGGLGCAAGGAGHGERAGCGAKHQAEETGLVKPNLGLRRKDEQHVSLRSGSRACTAARRLESTN